MQVLVNEVDDGMQHFITSYINLRNWTILCQKTMLRSLYL